MSGNISNLHFNYMNTSERRVLNLEDVGLPSVPMLGYCNYRNPRPDVPEHWHHGCIELHFCVRNTLSFGFNGRTYRLAPGEVFVNLPDERHTVSAHPKGLILYWMILRVDDKAGPFLQQPPQEAAALRQALLNIPYRHFRGTERIKRLFQSLHMLYDEPDTHLRTLRVRTTVLELLMEVLTAANAHTVPPGEERLEAQMREMQAHPENEFVVEELARQAGMAPTHFITRFRGLAGLPPRQFLLACRMQAARTLLLESNTPVTEIALRLGFCSSQHFANLFKRHTGITPLACRRGATGPHRVSDRDDGQSAT
ncbi:MAG TPA: AraC family transcriptional regulator [Kiritimatiellia bacterium]|nr:AraC family transcriptional regulator [Kiritimatiellia bacterium]HPS09425.1 AraC family transcriptional regulator [Kiritimatiellia bacterium]